MLCLYFSLQPTDASRFSQLLDSRRFLGDVFHGWFKRTLRDCAPGVYSTLRPTEIGPALYSLWCQPEVASDASVLNVRIALLGSATLCANELLAFLLAADSIDLGPPRCVFVPHGFEMALPGQESISLLDAETGLYEALPEEWLRDATATQLPDVACTSVQKISLQLLTAPRVGQLPAYEVPTLHQVAKVLLRKLIECEARTAAQLETDTAQWYEQLKALKACVLVSAEIEESLWVYQSENQPPHKREGWTGLVHFEGPEDFSVGPQVLQLLWLGQWLGLGQNTSGGQGAYQLNIG
jgi:CRISPR-associated endoribonuclease Cas6